MKTKSHKEARQKLRIRSSVFDQLVPRAADEYDPRQIHAPKVGLTKKRTAEEEEELKEREEVRKKRSKRNKTKQQKWDEDTGENDEDEYREEESKEKWANDISSQTELLDDVRRQMLQRKALLARLKEAEGQEEEPEKEVEQLVFGSFEEPTEQEKSIASIRMRESLRTLYVHIINQMGQTENL